MNQTSPLNTATAAGAAAIVAPVVAYIATLFRLTLPAEVLSSVVVLLVAGAHWIGEITAARYGTKAPAAPAAPAAGPGATQTGRSLIGMLCAIAVGSALMAAAGCTTTTASMYSGLYTQAKAGVQVFDDNTLHTARDIICAQPYSAIQRNTDLQPGVQVLCGPLANATSLNAGQLQLLMSVVGKAQAAGLLAVPGAPAAPAAAASGTK